MSINKPAFAMDLMERVLAVWGDTSKPVKIIGVESKESYGQEVSTITFAVEGSRVCIILTEDRADK